MPTTSGASPRPTQPPRNASRRKRRSRRARGYSRASRRRSTAGLASLLAAVAAAAIVYALTSGGGSTRSVASEYVHAWAKSDYPAMYRLLDRDSRRHLSLAGFEADYRTSAATATMTALRPGRVGSAGSRYVPVEVAVGTRLFGTLHELLEVPVSDPDGVARVHFEGVLLFPGLRAGEQLSRHSVLGRRGEILADNGTPLAEGPGQTSPLPGVASEITGTLGPIPPGQRMQYAALGYPPGAQVGDDGLELIFQQQLAGRPGATLLAGRRTLARAAARNGQTVRTTINPAVEEAAISALAGRYGGMTVIDPRTGALLGLAGVAFSALQPPGSTMKIVTVTAVLQDRLATPGTQFAVQSSANVGGYVMQNAAGEACGGTLLNAFAVSCDTVFAPLGVRLGGARLVSMAERFGFNQPTGIPGALRSTIPSASTIGDAVAVGSSAIGQGKVQASTLEMADAAAAIADHGRRPIPTFVFGARPRFVPVTSRKVAGEVQQMMEAVVSYGTGTAAQIPGVRVAGKTGTAELANTAGQANAVKDTDAWFVGYAPAGHAKVVACALFPSAGYGGDTAAPAVAQVLEAALKAHA